MVEELAILMDETDAPPRLGLVRPAVAGRADLPERRPIRIGEVIAGDDSDRPVVAG